jgi:DNA-binding NarL/FixJ family response regulator
MSIRVAIVEDEMEVRKLTASILNFYSDIECIGSFSCAEELITNIGTLLPEVVLMDIGLPGINGIECVRKIKPIYRGIQFVMLTSNNNPQITFEALAAGATGYILKSATPEKLTEAIREVALGGSPMSLSIARLVVETFHRTEKKFSELEKLSPQERLVLDQLKEGFAYKQIASRMFISISTIRTHVRHIYEKLEVHSRTEALNKVFK